jgi:ribonuclease HIII
MSACYRYNRFMSAPTKYTYYDDIKKNLIAEGFIVNPFRDINYGIQFVVFLNDEDALLRIYDGKKGIRLDYSQVKNDALSQKISTLIGLDEAQKTTKKKKTIPDVYVDDNKMGTCPDTDPAELIGIDESGKGDYFGALVVAAVHVDQKKSLQLKEWGVMDSKKLSDDTMAELAVKIKQLCHHSIISMGNTSYNEVYEQFKNLNHILAWGHARVLEGALKHVKCPYALSDQFGKKDLVENALKSKGIKVTLFQRHKAEDNIAVAAASILARDGFVHNIKKMEDSYKVEFPKGCSKRTLTAAIEFCQQFGREHLGSVAKMHFVVTKHVDDYLNNHTY